ncbi:MAG TPA: sulfotransferase family protein [Nocardioides sp.]|uniref:sulfotransferase family protein n=1 Tax=Nocardioides sp. TaxID=35761 RepID=UPI002F3F094E
MTQTQPRVTREALRDFFPGRQRGRFVLLPEHNVVFVKNAKAAASTITLWLHRIYTGNYTQKPIRNIHANYAMPHSRELGWGRVARMLDGEAFRFGFVREPMRRLESAYLDKIERTTDERWRDEIRRVLELPPDSPVGLDQFVDALEAQDERGMDPHWRPQHLNLMHPLVELDFVGRLENFDADLTRLRELAGLPDAPVTVRNVTKRPSGGVLDGHPGLQRRVRQVYAKDFELYGY